MNFTQRAFGLAKTAAIILSLALPLVVAASSADARIGGGVSSGSRGARTFSAPPTTAPRRMPRNLSIARSPVLVAPAWAPRPAADSQPAGHGFVRRSGRGIFGRGPSRHAVRWRTVRRDRRVLLDHRAHSPDRPDRHAGAACDVMVAAPHGPKPPMRAGLAPLGAQATFRTGRVLASDRQRAPGNSPADYEAFERLLGETQDAWSNEDIAQLQRMATPEMVSYRPRYRGAQGSQRRQHGFRHQALQGDLAEAWREGNTDFASVAMRYSLVDKTSIAPPAGGRRRRTAAGGDGSLDLPARARRRLGTVGDSADLTAEQCEA